MRRSRLIAALAGAALLAGACGVPTADTAQQLPNVPSGLVASPTSNPGGSGPAQVNVYFLRQGRLVETTANVTAPPTIAKALILLGYGPTASESQQGVTTALSQSPQQATVSYDGTTNGIATVTLDSTFEGMFGTKLVDALGQIVYTVTGPGSNAQRVLFQLDAEPFDAFLPDGTITANPVGRNDYREIAPLPSSTG